MNTHELNTQGFPGGADGKESACNVGDPGSIPGLADPLEKGMAAHSSILAWLENPMDRGAWRVTVHGVAESRTRLSDFTSHKRWTMSALVKCTVHPRQHQRQDRALLPVSEVLFQRRQQADTVVPSWGPSAQTRGQGSTKP